MHYVLPILVLLCIAFKDTSYKTINFVEKSIFVKNVSQIQQIPVAHTSSCKKCLCYIK